jgi:hypothetical protein
LIHLSQGSTATLAGTGESASQGYFRFRGTKRQTGAGPRASLGGGHLPLGPATRFVEQAAALEEEVLDALGQGLARTGVARHELEVPLLPAEEGVYGVRSDQVSTVALMISPSRKPMTVTFSDEASAP